MNATSVTDRYQPTTQTDHDREGRSQKTQTAAPTYSETYSIWVFDRPHVSPSVPCPAHEEGLLHPVSKGTEWATNGQ
jgi:hypothetical protein